MPLRVVVALMHTYKRLSRPCLWVPRFYDVGPLAWRRELVSRYSTDRGVGASPLLHTDDSGLEMHARPYNSSLSIGANYHAIVSMAYLQQPDSGAVAACQPSSNTRFSIFTPHT